MEKDSAILGYPGETSSPLTANHHGMSKFRDLVDANYIDVRNILRWLMNKSGSKDGPKQGVAFIYLFCITIPELHGLKARD